MRISFKKFAKANDGEIEINDLTVICGPNGTGKTYTSYAVYGVVQHFSEFFDYEISDSEINRLLEGTPVTFNLSGEAASFEKRLIGASNSFKSGLDSYFSAPDDFFTDCEFSFELREDELHPLDAFNQTINIKRVGTFDLESSEGSGDLLVAYSGASSERVPKQIIRRIISSAISDSLFGKSIPEPFVVTSERTGVALFYKELDVNRNAIFSHLAAAEKVDPIDLLGSMQSRYARPIKENIDVVRDYSTHSKKKSFIKESREKFGYIFEMWNDLVGGTFKDENDLLTFSPRKQRGKPKVNIPLYIASSSVKSLFLIDMYINYIAKEGGLLIIDEPELNLHPDNQVKIARLISRLVSAGVKVLVTTHSDYLVREINNLVTLSKETTSQKAIMERYGYKDEDLLKPSQVNAYCATPKAGLVKMGISDTGIDTSIFDDIINVENEKAQDIFYSAQD
ncbi:ATP-binding protein [Paracoccus sp. 1_MG-2023]|uniref:AAA family ATPase n=1 Tax=unclassified Paracoccus (in: a-proteobacteria) TaxID=2688777 RepID=UPI001C0864C5|nr:MULTISPECIES: ATP-binding protein [unclassified Paracoccus (in: a-proteobacteria)]MBU2957171.1 ATP-binding protein [Paracoccus sp. C2R09]MDO6669058.1 ATP-binding protein [Paracoccus sp. 1_MG-2023]